MNAGFLQNAGIMQDPAEDAAHDPPGLDPREQPPADRYCDVVLTGGVTDGVIYPWAVLELARKYRFKNIGGTSVGAMAATLTAAAEYGRRRNLLTGFNEVLLKLPRRLGEDVGGSTRLFSLFQPAPSTRRLFELFVGFVRSDADGRRAPRRAHIQADTSAWERRIDRIEAAFGRLKRRLAVGVYRLRRKHAIAAFVLGSLRLWLRWSWKISRVVLYAYRGPALLGVLLGSALGFGGWWFRHRGSWQELGWDALLSVLPWMTILVVLCVGVAIVLDLLSGFIRNGFGLCTGYRNAATPPGQQSLIEWLHEGIQAACGKALDRPLTFKHLWDAPGGPEGRPQPPARRKSKSRSIDLRMVTTNLTHERPYALPVEDETSRLFFREAELKPYFPPAILDHLVANSAPYTSKVDGVDPVPGNVPDDLFELPCGELPVVVAARLSLSFPVLFSAVPLWAIDYETGDYKRRRLRKCWFSDGGICSNFPVHLFDAALPLWPTFGIALVTRSLFWPDEATYLPKYYNQGRGDRWQRFGDEILPVTGERVPPSRRLLGFAKSIIWSAKDWNDKTSMRMPGVRDRVVRVNLRPGEGGLNLKLTCSQILRLARDYGTPAGKTLVEKFIGLESDARPSRFWDEHRWVRFNSLLVGLRERIEAIGAAADSARYAKPLSAQIADAVHAPPLCESDRDEGKPLTQTQSDELQRLLTALKELERQFDCADLRQPYTPLPTPSMRIRPPL